MDLTDGWEAAATAPGRCATPAELGGAGLEWIPATVPGTAAGAVGADGRDFDAEDWWFRCRFAADEGSAETELRLGGIATVAEVYLNGELVLESESMFAAHRVDLAGRLGAENELVIACRALAPLLARRRRPSARWRTRVVNAGNLRWYRTMMFGRSPGFAPGPAPVGPWRPVSLAAPDPLGSLQVRARVVGNDGIVTLTMPPAAGALPDRCEARIGDVRAALRAETELIVPDAALWWPHTHGDPVLHDLKVVRDGETLGRRRVGFRALGWAQDIPRDGLDLQVNGVPVWARGAVWTPADLVSMAPSPETLRALLERVRDAGMNMLRVVGTGAYEPPAFFDLCDELGILVWQDLMFGNLDYPVSDPAFREGVLREAAEVVEAVAGRPSLAVVCGNNEVEQQPAMMGLEPELGRDSLWDEELAGLVDASGAGCAYVRSTPCGGALPFHANAGVTHYFGVSGYFEPPAAARRADVRFASECLAFANVPDEVTVPVHHPDWKAGVPRDAGTGWDLGAGWDFDDVRDWYLRFLYGVDPVALRRSDLMRYLELSRHASGEVMAEVMGDWRRDASPCRGALVLQLKDMRDGAGLGVLDHRGAPKVAYHYLRRALAPVAVWMTDEEVNGVDVHVANDRPDELAARLRVALYRDGAARVAEAETEVSLTGHETRRFSVEQLVGTFVDAAWAYRFGPPAQDAIVATLHDGGGRNADGDGHGEVLSRAFFFPAGRPTERRAAAELGLRVSASGDTLRFETERLVYGLRISAPGFTPSDDAFCVEPGSGRTVALRRDDPDARADKASVTALNLSGQLNAT
jgi:beta-mannosidase